MGENSFRKDFPQLHPGKVYLDSAAMSLKPQVVIDSLNHYYQDLSVNIHRGLYDSGVETTMRYEETREKIASFLNASDEEEIVFTRGTTDSLNLVASSYGMTHIEEGDEIITSELEHHSSILPWMEVAKKKNATLKYIPLTEDGHITVENFKKVISNKTKIVAVNFVSNVLGYLTPVTEVIEIAHKHGAIVILDAAQAAPHMRIDVEALDVDFLAFSGHKMLAPTGVGILYGKKKYLKEMQPLVFGGDMSDYVSKTEMIYKDAPYKFEAGTMPVASIIAYKEAIEYLEKIDLKKIEEETRNVYLYALEEMKKIDGVEIYNPNSENSIIAFNLKDIPPHDAITFYAEQGICMRAGHHCAWLVSQFFGIEGCLRASFYLYNNLEDAKALVKTTKEAIEFFRKLGF